MQNNKSVTEQGEGFGCALTKARLALMLRDTKDALFTIDLVGGEAWANENFEPLFGAPIKKWRTQELNRIHPGDTAKIDALREGMTAGMRDQETHIRIRAENEEYFTYTFYLHAIYDANGTPRYLLGRLLSQQQNATIKKKIKRDSLTDVYDKEAALYLIERFLQDEGDGGVHGLLMVDVDDFVALNETRGKDYGDLALMSVAERIRGLFRKTDIVGRLQNDEFVVFLKNINSRAHLDSQAAALMAELSEQGNAFTAGPHVTCSLGGALYPEDGLECATLVQRAESALNRARGRAKNSYAIYHPDKDDVFA
ncbi:MAG: GGDEF domain-containing protein [Clostridiales bacterium]|jgi:diguanylate cyclase (GGDEF)-like protein|nr:GGDEF domain-containing protein [Clostridiales bacterium]